MAEARDAAAASHEGELVVGAHEAQSVLWQVAPGELDIEALGARVGQIFEALGHEASSATVVLVDDAAIAELNAQYRGVKGPTDVLSFSMLEGEDQAFGAGLLGDIVVSLDYAARLVGSGQRHRERVAAELQVAPERLAWTLLDEVTFLVIHGALHLVGHDHDSPQVEARMKAEECRLMRRWLRDIEGAPIVPSGACEPRSDV